MTNNVINVILCQTITLKQCCTIITHCCYSIAEDCATFLIGIMQTMVYRKTRWRTYRTACLNMQERKSLTICAMIRIYQTDSLLFCTFNHNSTRTITEKRTCRTITIISYWRHLICTNNDNTLMATALNHVAGYIKCIHETTASCSKVKCESILQT